MLLKVTLWEPLPLAQMSQDLHLIHFFVTFPQRIRFRGSLGLVLR